MNLKKRFYEREGNTRRGFVNENETQEQVLQTRMKNKKWFFEREWNAKGGLWTRMKHKKKFYENF